MKSRVVARRMHVIGHFFGSSLQTPQSEWITQTRGRGGGGGGIYKVLDLPLLSRNAV